MVVMIVARNKILIVKLRAVFHMIRILEIKQNRI